MASSTTVPGTSIGQHPSPKGQALIARNLCAGERWALAAIAGLVLMIVVALRLFGDAVLFAGVLRAYVARGSLVGLGLMIVAIATGPVWSHLFRARKLRWLDRGLAGFSLGVLLNVVCTILLAYQYDSLILSKAKAASRLKGYVTIQYPDTEPVTLCARENNSYVHSQPVGEVTNLEIGMLTSGEDSRFLSSLTGFDIVGIGRALLAFVEGRPLQGASGISSQLAGKLFDLKREGSRWDKLLYKVEKTAISLRVDDTLDRREQARLYLSLVSFGAIAGHEIVGIAQASQSCYGRQHEELTPAQLAELIGRVRNPSLYSPYPSRGANAEASTARRARLMERAKWILHRAEERKIISLEERETAEASLFSALATEESLRASLVRPRLQAVFRELKARVPDLDSRRLVVETRFDANVQKMLEEESARAAHEIDRAARGTFGEEDDPIVVDATLINSDGSIVASLGLDSIRSEIASTAKPDVYALAIESGVLRSMGSPVDGGSTAEEALAHSQNQAVLTLAQQIGIDNVANLFQSEQLFITGPFLNIVLGSGAESSPRNSAGAFAKFNYTELGKRVEPSLIVKVTDAQTGDVLFQPQKVRVFKPDTCYQIRQALEKAAAIGTAKKLAALAQSFTIAAKTGTAAFKDTNGQWRDNSGSWCLAADSATKCVIAVRMRRFSGRPFELEAADSAVLVVRDFISAHRSYVQHYSARR